MWWGTAVNGCGMPFGMFMMPMFFLIILVFVLYSFNRRMNAFEDHQSGSCHNRDDIILSELREIKEELRDIKKGS
jgi:uncharacterized membrane protein